MEVKPFDLPGMQYAMVESSKPEEHCALCPSAFKKGDLVCIAVQGNAVICWDCTGRDIKRKVAEASKPRILV